VNRPRWDDPQFSAGAMVRAALWLLDVVGEGNTFTKEQAREAFPGLSQVDRRIRDLRDFGWIIHTRSDDAMLLLEEQRFVKAGIPVWDPQARRKAQTKTITSKERLAALAADGYQCTICGVAGGEPYPESSNETAVLGITRKAVQAADGELHEQLITECKRCKAGKADPSTMDVSRLLAEIRTLDQADQDRLQRWIERGKRGPTPLDRVWNGYRRLPDESRDEVRRHLEV
jgi:hypothetical protein